MFTPKIGEDFQFDDIIFLEMGWNHHLGNDDWKRLTYPGSFWKLLLFLFNVFWIIFTCFLVKDVWFSGKVPAVSSVLAQCYMIVLLQIMFGEFGNESHILGILHTKRFYVLRNHPKRKQLWSGPWECIETWVHLQVTSPLRYFVWKRFVFPV